MAIVVVTGRAGKNPPPGTTLVTVPTNSKKEAYAVAEEYFRKRHDVDKNIALRSTTVFEGTDDECTEFHNRLAARMEEAQNG